MTPPVDDFPCNVFVEARHRVPRTARCRPTTSRRLEEHLAICAGCESVLEQFRAVIRMEGRLGEQDVDALTPAQREPVMAAFRAWAAGRS